MFKIKKFFLSVFFCGVIFIPLLVNAGGSIFKHKEQTYNSEGVNSIGVHICSNLVCPKVLIIEKDCSYLPHSSSRYGVCMCDTGYVLKNGKCVESSSSNCTEIDSCDKGYFCNFGGEGTPNACQKVVAETFEQNGTTYYFNRRSDLNSWCRSTEGTDNCVYGYLTYYAAYDWCLSLGGRLLTSEEVSTLPSEWRSELPWGSNMRAYWLEDGRIMANGTIGGLGDASGWEGTGGVVCIKDNESASATGGSSGIRWMDVEGCNCNTEEGVSTDTSDELCNIQCCRDKYGENGYEVNKTCCQKDDNDCICAANGCKTGSNTTPLDDFCCAKMQGLI